MGQRQAIWFVHLGLALALLLTGCGEVHFGSAAAKRHDIGVTIFRSKMDLLLAQPPLHERGVKALALLYRPADEGRLALDAAGRPVGLAGDGGREAVSRRFVEERFLAEASRAPHVTAALLNPDERLLAALLALADPFDGVAAAMAKGAGADGESAAAASETAEDAAGRLLAALRARGIDSLLLVEEPAALPDFLTGTAAVLPAKGLFARHAAYPYVYAAFRFRLIDTASGRERDNTQFLQASAELLSLDGLSLGVRLNAAEQARVDDALRQRVANNIDIMLQLLKAIPGADGGFLTEDPST